MNVLSKFPSEHSDGTLEGLAQHEGMRNGLVPAAGAREA